ncbi:MAG TPA: DinB family protein [Bryobacteraceae bacterium]|nr:DinB family protein [Bryobacteraceae bacterium]
MKHDQGLRRHLIELLRGGQAHLGFDDAVRDFPPTLQGAIPHGGPHSGWQLLEHLRIAQRDILDFSHNEDGRYRELKWPAEYWPPTVQPPDEGAWEKSVKQFREDTRAMEELLQDNARDLYRPFPWGNGQTLLREALLLADHNSYHIGQLVLLRRLLGAFPGR